MNQIRPAVLSAKAARLTSAKIAGNLLHSTWTWMCLLLIVLVGCGRTETTDITGSDAPLGVAADSQQLTTSVDSSAESPLSSSAAQEPTGAAQDYLPDDAGPNQTSLPARSSSPRPSSVRETVSRKQLARDLAPDQLGQFLAEADQEMRRLASTPPAQAQNPQEIADELKWIIQLKQVAAQRLIEHADSTDAQVTQGRRGQLQALSHLASMGDLKAAEQLESLAKLFASAEDPQLSADSQLVLIGFAIERMRHGKEDAQQQVVTLIESMLDGTSRADVATMMVMGQALDALRQYEHSEQAEQVRRLILDRFASNDDPEVARMAARIAMAGQTSPTDSVEQIQQLHQNLTSAPVDQWRQAAVALLAEQPDIQSVSFLAAASLEAEAIGRDDIAAATYQILQSKVDSFDGAMAREARVALQARANRLQVIGQQFDPDYPPVRGAPIDIADYRGKVVLIPFWSSTFPQSLSVLEDLRAIKKRYPDQVAIVGMNLDPEGTDVATYMSEQGLGFPSFRAESKIGAEIVNEVAFRFGAVSMVYVAILGTEGRVEAIEFSGEDLLSEVEKRLPAN